MTHTPPDTASVAEELRRRNREATALYEIGRQIAASRDPETILSLIVKNAQWLLETHCAGVALCEGENRKPVWRAVSGTDRWGLEGLLREPVLQRGLQGNGAVRQDPSHRPGDSPEASAAARGRTGGASESSVCANGSKPWPGSSRSPRKPAGGHMCTWRYHCSNENQTHRCSGGRRSYHRPPRPGLPALPW